MIATMLLFFGVLLLVDLAEAFLLLTAQNTKLFGACICIIPPCFLFCNVPCIKALLKEGTDILHKVQGVRKECKSIVAHIHPIAEWKHNFRYNNVRRREYAFKNSSLKLQMIVDGRGGILETL
jgi:hypothetical protein